MTQGATILFDETCSIRATKKRGLSGAIVALVFYVNSFASLAQNQCPPGMLPGQGKCLSQQEVLWSRRTIGLTSYGTLTISLNESNNIIGTSYGIDSREQANAIAMGKCGGDCIIWAEFSNTCVAVTEGSTGRIRAFADFGRSEGRAEKKAMSKCRDAKFGNCRVIFSACSLPRWIDSSD